MSEAILHTGGFSVLRNQTALPPRIIGSIRNLTVQQEINVPATFSFTLTLVGGETGGMLDTFAPGDEITILMGRDRLQRLIIGQITAIEPQFGQFSTATIRGFDRMYRLYFGEQNAFYDVPTYGDVAAQVGSSVDLRVRVMGEAPDLPEPLTQKQQSNYNFLLELAAEIDYELVMDGVALVFRPPGQNAAPVRTLLFPRDLSSVDLNLRVPIAGAKVVVYGIDSATNEKLRVESEGSSVLAPMSNNKAVDSFPSSAISEDHMDVGDVEALLVIANARRKTALKGLITGQATLTGDPTLVAGVTVKISGLSSIFDGPYYITNAVHTYDDDTGYQTTLTLERDGT